MSRLAFIPGPAAVRLSEFGRLHRNERSGTLSGLTRVPGIFVQDDAHIYLRPDQLQDEKSKALLGEVYEVYGWFGLRAQVHLWDEAGQGPRRPGAVETS